MNSLAPEQTSVRGALTRLSRDAEHLPRVLRLIALHIQQNPGRVLYQTVTELATEVGVGEASVIRLCQALGFKGFQDFKLVLAADLSHKPHPPVVGEESGNQGSQVLARTLSRAQQALQDTYQSLDVQALECAARKLAVAGCVELGGQGASGVTAQDFAYKLLRLGKHVGAQTDPHLAAMRAATLSAADVAIGISRSGSTLDTVQFLKVARQAGAYTIALTISALSPIAEFADCVLLTANPEGPSDGGSITNKISQMLVLEALYHLLLLEVSSSAELLRMTAAAVADKNY